MKKLKLTSLNKDVISEREMKNLKGGNYCECSCYYADKGGSSRDNNGDANYGSGTSGKTSINGETIYWKYDRIG